MAWQVNGTPDTLTVAGDVMTISDQNALIFNQAMVHDIRDGAIASRLTYNNDTNNVYTRRQSSNGGTDTTNINQSAIGFEVAGDGDVFAIINTLSISGQGKLIILHSVGNVATGSGTAPSRKEIAAKFVPSPDADITRIDITNNVAGDYAIDSNLSALGTD